MEEEQHKQTESTSIMRYEIRCSGRRVEMVAADNRRADNLPFNDSWSPLTDDEFPSYHGVLDPRLHSLIQKKLLRTRHRQCGPETMCLERGEGHLGQDGTGNFHATVSQVACVPRGARPGTR